MEAFSKVVNLLTLALYGVQAAESMIVGYKRGQVKKEMASALVNGGLDLAEQTGELSAEDAAKGKAVGGAAIDLVHSVLDTFNLLKPHQAG